jgi:spore germination protein YaaH
LLPVAVASAVACAASEASLEFGAWITYWDFDRGLARVASAPTLFDDLFYFVAELDGDGNPVLARPELVPRLPAAGPARGGRSWLTVVNDRRPAGGGAATLKDAAAVQRLLGDATARARHRRAIVELAALHGFSGVDVDYENLYLEDRQRFSDFAQELAADLAARQMRLSVTVQPKRGESRSVGPGAADWPALCQAAERVQVMLYNQHSSRTGPGPMASPGWMREVLGYGASRCPKDRLVPVLKVSGMDWGPAGAKELQHVDAVALLAAHAATLEREADGQTPHFRYATPEGPHHVYFEDAQSVLGKIAVLEELGFRRVVLWSLGREDPELVPRLAARKAPVPPSQLVNSRGLGLHARRTAESFSTDGPFALLPGGNPRPPTRLAP